VDFGGDAGAACDVELPDSDWPKRVPGFWKALGAVRVEACAGDACRGGPLDDLP
jgi:hypothetical protein